MSNSRASEVSRARKVGIFAAAREHARLVTNLSRPVDIFHIIESQRVWLLFMPLGNLYGFYLNEHQAPGVVINAKHPRSLQRFTAAHEYGHYVLDHKPVLDDEQHIHATESHDSIAELEAYTFASHFLMPIQLVTTLLRDMGLAETSSRISTRDAYLLSLEMGVSYPAAVNQLAALGFITWPHAKTLREFQPRQIKNEIAVGQDRPDSWADIWLLEERHKGKLLNPRVNDELHTSLPETPSTGSIWTVRDSDVVDLRERSLGMLIPESASIALMADQYVPPPSNSAALRIGSRGTRHMVFRLLRPGLQRIYLEKRRPWLVDEPADEQYEVTLNVSTKPTGSREWGPSVRQLALPSVAA